MSYKEFAEHIESHSKITYRDEMGNVYGYAFLKFDV